MPSSSFRHVGVLAVALALPAIAIAQYPDRAVTIEVGFPPGTGPDIVARAIGQQLGHELGQSVVIQNKAGAGGQIAAQSVARAKPDGYTLLLGEVGSMAIAPAAYRELNYAPAQDFAPIIEAVRVNMVLAVPADSPHKTLQDFLAAARDTKQPIHFGTFGAGTPGHFGAELFASEAGFPIEAVHYRNTSDAITGLGSSDVQAAFITTALAAPHVESGRLRALAVTGAQRARGFPDAPTFIEADLLKVDFGAWFGYFAPKGTPDAVLDVLHDGIAKAIQAPAVTEPLEKAGFVMMGGSRADMKQLLEQDLTRWTDVVKATGFQM